MDQQSLLKEKKEKGKELLPEKLRLITDLRKSQAQACVCLIVGALMCEKFTD